MRFKNGWPVLLLAGLIVALAGASEAWQGHDVFAQGEDVAMRRVNAPYVSGTGNIPASRHAVFWFGQVTATSNHTNVRVAYNDRHLRVTLHVFDKFLWYAPSPTPSEFANWDAATLYLNLNGNTGTTPGSQSYRFRTQLSNYGNRVPYQQAYRGNGSGWQAQSTPFETQIIWRGGEDGMNNLIADRGWVVIYDIPYASLGLNGKPAQGAQWGMALTVHDRDDAAGATINHSWWPGSAVDGQPGTWGLLHFGMPQYTPPFASAQGQVTVRQGLNGVQVPDAHVGGHSLCGDPFHPEFFTGWGGANYAGYDQINIQNQWDVADWPCFSRYYITFPLNQIPAGKIVLSATLTMYQFGNSNPAQAEPSRIQVLTVGEDWNEATINWNNAPLAVENVDIQQVDPVPGGHAPYPGQPRTWDVSGAVAQALNNNAPLRLVLYSADGAYHSGKYFSSSDAEEDHNRDVSPRPALTVVWGDMFTGEVERNYLPLMTHR